LIDESGGGWRCSVNLASGAARERLRVLGVPSFVVIAALAMFDLCLWSLCMASAHPIAEVASYTLFEGRSVLSVGTYFWSPDILRTLLVWCSVLAYCLVPPTALTMLVRRTRHARILIPVLGGLSAFFISRLLLSGFALLVVTIIGARFQFQLWSRIARHAPSSLQRAGVS
jgi:hypothetical protein